MKLIILFLLIGVIVSLGSGLFFLTRDTEGGSQRLLTALKFRVALSVALVAFLVMSYLFGWIAPPTMG